MALVGRCDVRRATPAGAGQQEGQPPLCALERPHQSLTYIWYILLRRPNFPVECSNPLWRATKNAYSHPPITRFVDD